jgi:hypothetical protein
MEATTSPKATIHLVANGDIRFGRLVGGRNVGRWGGDRTRAQGVWFELDGQPRVTVGEAGHLADRALRAAVAGRL